MPGPMMTEDGRHAFVAESHIAVLSVASHRCHPLHTVPMFYAYEPGGNVIFYPQV